MSEHDANRAMLDTARLRILHDPLEQTQRMTFSQKQQRAAEATMMRHHKGRAQRAADFREHSNGTLRREHRLTVHEIAQQDGFPGDDIQ
jgi:hypothetical protein